MSVDVPANESDETAARVSVEQRRKSYQRTRLYANILVPLSFAVLMFGVLAVALLLHFQEVDPKPVPVPPGISESSLARIEFELQHATFDMKFALAKQAVQHLESAKTEWETLLELTLGDSVGERIAGNEELLIRFRALRSLPVSEKEQSVKDARASLKAVRLKVRDASDDVESLTRQTLEIDDTTASIFYAYASYQSRIDHLQAIRVSAASQPASKFELRTALSMREAAVTNRAKATAEEATRDLGASLARELAQLTKQQEDGDKLIKQLNSQFSRVEKGELLNSEAVDEGVQPQASRIDYGLELDDIRTKLVAFTTPGYVQPESADQLVYHRTKSPISYSILLRIGALEGSKKGLATLLRVGGSKSANQQNDRPLGNFPRMNSVGERSEPDARVVEAQRLLRQYGPLMVEDGLLSR